MVKITAGDTRPVQAEVATQEVVTILTFKALVVTSEMRELMVQHASVLLGGTNATPPLYESTTTTIVETGLGSTLPVPVLVPVTDIMEELTLQIVGKFIMTMKYCVELVLSGRSPFEFVRSLLENQIKNIRQTGGSDHVIVYQALVDQLGIYSKDLRNLKRVSPVADAQRVSEDLRIK